jgi:hypothetical protein
MWLSADGLLCTYAGYSTIEPGTPKEAVNLYWSTFDDYADQCAWSRVLGGKPLNASSHLTCRC